MLSRTHTIGKEATMKKITDSMRQLEAALGHKYTLMPIDEVWCLYRDLGNGYDVEINMGKTRKYALNVTVYVWQVRDELKIIEKIQGINGIEDLKGILAGVVNETNKLSNKKSKLYRPELVQVI